MELVFEIGCEELPARFVEPALEQIKDKFVDKCDHRRIDVDNLKIVGTPRRLGLLVYDLAETQSDLNETQTGPPANVAFDDGEPTSAAEGFARAKGIDPGELYIKETEKGAYAAADIHRDGKPTKQLLPEILTEILSELHFPKSMRWGKGEGVAFGRPIRWLLGVADGDPLGLSYAGVESDTFSRGHRFAAPDDIEIESCDEYIEKLEAHHVIVEPEKRKEIIRKRLDELAESVGGRIREDEELVTEVAHLIEEPQATLLDFSEDYLVLPDEVLITSMRSHQRYFSIQEPDSGELMSYSGVIYNTPVETPDKVTEGNLKVLRARLDDAKFFWDKDRKRPLESYVDSLEDVVWVQKLGSMKKRSERIGDLGGKLSEFLGLGKDDKANIRRAGYLSKADLVTEMVHEFPNLQGVMGREYALKSDESEAVALAIEEQYRPDGADGDLPETDVGDVVSVAEKLDAIVGCFGVGMEPSSESDPYGLRRNALGIIRILDNSRYRIDFSTLIRKAIAVYEKHGLADSFADSATLVDRIQQFISTRLRYWLRQDYPTDVVDAVVEVGHGDVKRITGLVESVARLQQGEDFLPLARGFKRIENILQKEDVSGQDEVDEKALEEPQEKDLFDAYKASRNKVAGALEQRNWQKACRGLIELKEPVDAFFDNVMVMTDDKKLHRNRIALLNQLRRLFMRVADIGHIQVE